MANVLLRHSQVCVLDYYLKENSIKILEFKFLVLLLPIFETISKCFIPRRISLQEKELLEVSQQSDRYQLGEHKHLTLLPIYFKDRLFWH